MKLSVVISTLNNREQLLTCLDTLSKQLPNATERIVVNGPSSDGTTGAVRDRSDVDVLVEISERNRNVSRNAGIEAASGDVIAFLGDEYVVGPAWYESIVSAARNDVDVVTGPVRGRENPLSSRIGIDPDSYRGSIDTVDGRSIPYVDGTNAAFDRSVLNAIDGFDEYLEAGGSFDCSHRIAGCGFDVTWNGELVVQEDMGTDGGRKEPDWGRWYRSLSYRLMKNYGLHPSVLARIFSSEIRDGYAMGRAALSDEGTPSGWLGNGMSVLRNTVVGVKDGLRARYADRTPRRNPHGISTRRDRAVQVYDRRS